MTSEDDELLGEIIDTFVEEADRHMAAIEALLRAKSAGRAASDSPIKLYHAVHAIRGSAGLIGFQYIAQALQAAERELVRVRDEGAAFDAQMEKTVREGVASCEGLIEQVRKQGTDGSDLTASLGLGEAQ